MSEEIRAELASPDVGGDAVEVTPIWISRRTRNLILVAAGVLLLVAIWRVPGILTIALGGVAFALILSFPVRWLSRLMPRWLGIGITLLILFGIFILALISGIPLIIDQLTDLVAAWPSIQGNIGRWLRELGELGEPLRERGLVPESAPGLGEQVRQELNNRSQEILTGILSGTLDLVTGTIGFAVQAFAILFIGVYLLIDAHKVRDTFVAIMPDQYQDDAAALWQDFGESVSRYLGGVIIIAAIEGSVTATGLWLIGLPYALLLGVWVAMTSVIPTFGPWLGAVPAVPLALAQSPTMLLLTALVYLVVQQLEGNLLTPRVQGQTANVHPVIVLLTVIWVGQAFGLLWSVLAVPALVVLRVLFDFFRERVRIRRAAVPSL